MAISSSTRRLAIGSLLIAGAIPFIVGLGAMTTAISVGVARLLLLIAVVLGAVGLIALMRAR